MQKKGRNVIVLKDHSLNKIEIPQFVIYDLCKVQLTVEHIIVQCRQYTVNRHQLNISLSLNDNLEDKESILKLIHFLNPNL